MNNVSIFWLQLFISVGVSILILVWYVWPYLTKLPRNSALIALLFVHVFRYLGMTLLVPGMVDSKLPKELLYNTAYGDLLAALLALIAIFALRSKKAVGILLAWVFNMWGFLDLLNALRTVFEVNLPSYYLGSVWFVYTFYAPLVIISHLMIFWILIKSKSWNK